MATITNGISTLKVNNTVYQKEDLAVRIDTDTIYFDDRIFQEAIPYSEVSSPTSTDINDLLTTVQGYLNKKESQYGAFGESITAHKTPVVQIANKYNLDPDNDNEIEIFEATGGSADNNGNLFRCQTGTSVGGYGVIRSINTLNYKAGQGIEAQFTAKFTTGIALSLQFAGLFNLTETLAFGYDGADFSCLHSYGGAAEVQLITVTATGAGTCTVTLDGDAVGISVTNSDVQTNAEELRAGLVADATLNGKWRFEQIDDKVFCISKTVGDKTGTMSVSGGVTASIAEQTAGVVKTDNHIAQTNWNVTTNPFDGFDPTKLNLYKVQFGYLGVANIDYFIYNPNIGEFVLVHRIKWANENTVTHLGSPNLKIGWTAASLGASGTNLTVEGASAELAIQGDEVLRNNTHATEASKGSIGGTLTNVLTLKNRVVYNDRFNLVKIKALRISVDNDHTKGAVIQLWRNSTLGGTTNYQYHGEFSSVVLEDTAGTTLTGGHFLDGFAVGANESVSVNLTDILPDIFPDDTLTIAAKTASGSGATITAVITWREDI